MSLRTKFWGLIGSQARRTDLGVFSTMPALAPPDPIGLRSSEQAWGVPNVGVLIADELPPSVVGLRTRAIQTGVGVLLRLFPNTERRSRWSPAQATAELVDFLGGQPKPHLWNDWGTDTGWARAFVQGPCAGDLRREEDVWVVDASVLAFGERRTGVPPLGVKVAIHVDEQGPRPAWIQMQDGKRIRPTDAAWEYARMVASAAMHNYVSHVRHVINTHYIAAQGIAVLVHNHLPWHHPIARFLFPHAAGSLASNWSANRNFMGVSKIGEQTYAFTWKGLQQLVPLAFRAFEWAEYNTPEALARRGVTTLIDQKLYPYGEDALLIWNVLDKYAADYLSQYYKDDSEVLADTALQAAFEALDPAIAKPIRAKSLAELRLVLTRFVAMVSVEHKLVSGIAYDYFTHPYYFPSLVREGNSPEDAAPFREEAENNVMFRCAISARAWPMLADWSYVALDSKGADAMRRFQDALRQAGNEIDARNKRRKVPFPHFHPSELETSVAV
jgi:hypothetical protein